MSKCGEIIDKKGCGKKLEIEKTPDSPHYAKINCPECGFRGFKPKPENEGNRKSSSKSSGKVFEFHNQSEERCFLCRRKKEELGFNETFTVDHIHELDKGGEDKIENMQVLCTACHKLKNHQRLYHNWHQETTTQSNRGAN